MSYDIHPLADLIPEMDADQFNELRADIERNGQLQPITIFEEKILDGRHRYRACSELGIDPQFQEWDGPNPAGYVLSLNVSRRHLTTIQRAMLATRVLPALREEARERLVEGAARGGSASPGSKEPGLATEPDRATKRAGDLVGVSRASVTRAARVAEQAPEMVAPIIRGDVTVTAVDRQLRDGKPASEATPAPPTGQREQIVARAHRDRINKLVWSLDGYVKGIPAINVDAALSAATDDEAAHWRSVLAEAARAFRALRSQMEEA